MLTITAHIINHTHWDREWFLSCVYTTHWVPALIDKIAALSAANPDFRYLLDGQTLVIEDLLAAYPAYKPKVAQLIRAGNLSIGPFYAQPDWQLTDGESLMRNLKLGQQDVRQWGGTMGAGWLVDTFGHISQAPQILQQFDLDAVYVWRGVPQMHPYFTWEGADGTTIFGVNLFGGYRNLYGVTHAPEVAYTRLEAEIDKLAPHYPTPDVPLFDGYDLEDNPEDPITFFQQRPATADYQLREATPTSFAQTVRAKLTADLPVLRGELNSGKYAATFPGTYTTRSYAKIMGRDCAHALYRQAEPLAVLARLKGRVYDTVRYEKWSRLLIQNNVHDVICGVSIDQVHEKAEDIYRQLFANAHADIQASLNAILRHFAPGQYAISTNPFAHRAVVEVTGHTYQVDTQGIGVWPLFPISSPKPSFDHSHTHRNKHYQAELWPDGAVAWADGRLGYLAVYEEWGDTYSDKTGDLIARLSPSTPYAVTVSGAEKRVQFRAEFSRDNLEISAEVQIIFDAGPLIRWEVDLDSRGTAFCVEFVCEMGVKGQVWAGMPFDVVPRPFVDTDLLPREVGPELGRILMGQRELNEIRAFPFHDFVALDDGQRSAVVFAKGVNGYKAYQDGRLAIILRRSVEWVTRANLANRIGDAGPFFYVPDARGERAVRHELAFAAGAFAADSMTVQHLNAAYQNPPLIVDWHGHGTETVWSVCQAEMPLSSLRVGAEQIVARWFNPTGHAGWAASAEIRSKAITTTALPIALPALAVLSDGETPAAVWLNAPAWRVGENQGLPDVNILAELRQQIATLEATLAEAQQTLIQTTGRDRYFAQHRVYIYHRELLEYQLSLRLNEMKLALVGQMDHNYLYEPDPEVAKIGWELNQLRIKRRIYDYVVAVL